MPCGCILINLMHVGVGVCIGDGDAYGDSNGNGDSYGSAVLSYYSGVAVN